MSDLRVPLADALGERYELQGEVGRGGMATVYAAYDRKLGRRVAVKALHPHLSTLLGPDRFLREIAIAASLQHPNIVPLYESGGAGDLLYFTMPLVEGETLRARLDRESQLPVDEAIRIASAIGQALSYAHSHGIVHRDLKPENVLLAGETVLVSDFGLARAISEAGASRLTTAGVVVGTPAYMSPEQAAGAPRIDGRSDLYALGCVLFEMLGGDPPFSGHSAQALLARQMHQPPPSLRVVRPTVSLALEEVVGRALAKTPADRFAVASAFVAALDGASHAPPTPVRRLGGRRARVAAASIAAAGLLALVVWHVIPHGPALDVNKVIVFPLAARGPAADDPAPGQDAALELLSALENVEPLRVVDGWHALAPSLRNDVSQLSERTEFRLARERGAGRFIDGSVTTAADTVRVLLRLYDVVGDSEITHASAAGTPLAAVHHTVLRAFTGLLAALVGRSRQVDLSYLTDRDPAVLADWLYGEREYRRADYGAAMTHYRRALARDSTMAVAALKAAQCATWLEDLAAADTLVQLALRHDTSLPARNRRFARGLQEYLSGSPDSAVTEFHAAIASDTGWSEAWGALGEVYTHLMPGGLAHDSLGAEAFTEAVRFDPEFAPPLYHLAQYTVLHGTPRAADQVIAHWRRISADTIGLLELELMRSCVRDPATVDWRAAAVHHPEQVLSAGHLLSTGVRYPRCGADAFDAVLGSDSASLGERYDAMQGRHYLDLALGAVTPAVALVDSAVHAGTPAAQALIVFDALVGTGSDSAAAAVIASLDVPRVRTSAGVQWFFGLWAAHRHDRAALDDAAATLARIADSSGKPQDREAASVVAARASLARGDSATAVRLLESLREVPAVMVSRLAWRWWYGAPTGRMLLAELLLRRGRPRDARRVAESFEGSQAMVNVALIPWSLRLRVRAAEAMGAPVAAARYRARLDHLEQFTLPH